MQDFLFHLIQLCLATSCPAARAHVKRRLNAPIMFFLFQSYPASLQLLIHAEGEALVLLLEKNEWVSLWFILVLCPYSPTRKRLQISNVNHSQETNPVPLATPRWGCMYKRKGSCMGPGYDIAYSGRVKIICPPVIGPFFFEGPRDESR